MATVDSSIPPTFENILLFGFEKKKKNSIYIIIIRFSLLHSMSTVFYPRICTLLCFSITIANTAIDTYCAWAVFQIKNVEMSTRRRIIFVSQSCDILVTFHTPTVRAYGPISCLRAAMIKILCCESYDRAINTRWIPRDIIVKKRLSHEPSWRKALSKRLGERVFCAVRNRGKGRATAMLSMYGNGRFVRSGFRPETRAEKQKRFVSVSDCGENAF